MSWADSKHPQAWHVGVVGSGAWCGVHLAALTASPYVKGVTLCGRNAAAVARWAAEFPIVTKTIGNLAEMLDDPTVRLVNVVLPHHLHASTTRQALQAGKAVICEKPSATNLADFDAMLAAASTAGQPLLVVMNQLYNTAALKTRQMLDAGEIGRPFLALENAFRAQTPHYRDPAAWRTSVAGAGGGVLIDGGFHMVYRHLYQLASFGPPQWVNADAAQLNVDPQGQAVSDKGEDFVAITIGYPGALRIQWSHGWMLAENPVRARQSFIAGSNGTLEMTDDEQRPLLLLRQGTQTQIEVPRLPQSGRDTTHVCLLDYVECLFQNRLPERATNDLARRTLEVILAAFRSAKEGRRVELTCGR